MSQKIADSEAVTNCSIFNRKCNLIKIKFFTQLFVIILSWEEAAFVSVIKIKG